MNNKRGGALQRSSQICNNRCDGTLARKTIKLEFVSIIDWPVLNCSYYFTIYNFNIFFTILGRQLSEQDVQDLREAHQEVSG